MSWLFVHDDCRGYVLLQFVVVVGAKSRRLSWPAVVCLFVAVLVVVVVIDAVGCVLSVHPCILSLSLFILLFSSLVSLPSS